ncbi:MAG TPA: threonine/serine dehydratase [Symbiobacteriaceae bacterium]|nr:threonine/serine dehydratase [Symbiobacteriaceae bacterium]
MKLPVLTDVLDAARTIAPYVGVTPLEYSPALSRQTGAEVYLKLEMLRETRAFKIRGACNFMAHLSAEQRQRGVVAASGGSHAQGVAFAARRFGVKATIVMTERSPANLRQICRDYGAEVIVAGQVYEDAGERAAAIAAATGAVTVHSFDDPLIVAGQGTIGLEILQALPEVDAIIAPVGGGGLLGGVGLAAKSVNPAIRVIGVEPAGAASMTAALVAGRPVRLENVGSVADKLVTRSTGALNLALAQKYCDEVVLVEEGAIRQAMRDLLGVANLLAEGAAASALAALRLRTAELAGKRVALILTGGNIDAGVLASLLGEAIG